MSGELWRQQVQPDLAVLVDDSLCIVLECGFGEHKRYVTVSDCDAVAAAMNLARVYVGAAEDDERAARRLAEGDEFLKALKARKSSVQPR